MTRAGGKTNTAERQLDGVQRDHFSGDCVTHRSPKDRQRARTKVLRKQPLPGEVLYEEVLFLLPDRNPQDIADALGYANPGSIARSLYRHGHPEEARVFERVHRRQQRLAVAA